MPIRKGSFGNEPFRSHCETVERIVVTVSADEWAAIDQLLSTPDANAGVLTQLRGRFAHLSWTRCDASDVIEAPFRSYRRFDVHLLNSADHCSHITDDLALATGIILAMRDAAR